MLPGRAPASSVGRLALSRDFGASDLPRPLRFEHRHVGSGDDIPERTLVAWMRVGDTKAERELKGLRRFSIAIRERCLDSSHRRCRILGLGPDQECAELVTAEAGN